MKKNKQYIFVANWKMYLSFKESVSFCTTNNSSIQLLANKHKIIFLPSFIALDAVSKSLEKTGAFFGAQNCSEFETGAYTGEISPLTLAETGCSYCLIGHQERRIYFNETDEKIEKKLHLLINAGITPIFCIGEEKNQDISIIKQIMEKQLSVLIKVKQNQPLLIAYEPSWRIGKNEESLNKNEIEHIKNITQFLATALNSFTQAKLLYGGGINQYNIESLLKIREFNGFLIGSSSTNFSELKSIITKCSQ